MPRTRQDVCAHARGAAVRGGRRDGTCSAQRAADEPRAGRVPIRAFHA